MCPMRQYKIYWQVEIWNTYLLGFPFLDSVETLDYSAVGLLDYEKTCGPVTLPSQLTDSQFPDTLRDILNCQLTGDQCITESS